MPKKAESPDPPSSCLAALGRSFADAADFVAVAHRVCVDGARLFELRVCALALHRESGGPAVLVDNLPAIDDPFRHALVDAAGFAHNPLYAPDLDHGAVAAFAQRHWLSLGLEHALVLPLINSSETIGSIVCGSDRDFELPRRRDLATLATQVSVRLAQLGVAALGCEHPRAQLTPRQYEIAALVVDGASNVTIAAVLEISLNTVKKLLKQVFERLGVHSRTQLAMMFRELLAPIDIPFGVTRLRTITVTRGR